ncbi:cytochrome P450 [Rhodococcus oryzae]|uniref:cytochrome P450 n=1 Tax=Rhodococcus oryzae TaxID=2571143 RepID=UPI00378F5DD5
MEPMAVLTVDRPSMPHPPRRIPLLGDLLDVDVTKPTQNAMACARRLGPIYQRKIFNYVFTFVSGADLATELNDERRFQKHVGVALRNLRPIGNDGLFTAYNSEPNWSKAHNILMPAFTQSAMRSYHQTMLDTVRELIEHWDGRCDSAPVEVTPDMTKVTLETIGRTGFGYEFGSFDRAEQDPFVGAMIRSLRFAQRASFTIPIPILDRAIKRKAIRRNQADLAYMAEVVDEVIRSRRANPEEHRDDLLGLMLSAEDPESGERLDDENVRDQVITFLIAGHETSSGALSFALYYLANNPEIAERARAEIYSMWPQGTDPDPAFEQIPKLRYVRRVLDETLRLWPTAPGYMREAREDTVLGGRYPMKAGDAAFVLLPQLHRDPVWGDDPDAFAPDRFLPANVRTRPGHVYKPFGTGIRSCIGRQFAIHEIVMALALLLHRYDLEPEPDYELDVTELLTLKPEGFRLRLHRR